MARTWISCGLPDLPRIYRDGFIVALLNPKTATGGFFIGLGIYSVARD